MDKQEKKEEPTHFSYCDFLSFMSHALFYFIFP